ncbi:MAG: sodium:alanine symporter family protein [Alphaproteobacteria bacterium]|nr:sodium:alanine symporter family protein [Alphaproteobacteria bacterium]
MNLDSLIDSLLSPIADKISGIIFSSVTIHGVKVEFLIALLMSAAIYFTIRTGFIGFWGFKHAIKLITKNYEHKDTINRKKHGEVSAFQALTATISASAGIGNVAGSAAAVSIGGPGVIFWMMVAGLFSMALKFAEVLLGIKLRYVNKKDGTVAGGPMYYILAGLKNHKLLGRFAPALAKSYAVCCIFAMIGGWNLFQINAMTTQITEVTGGENSFFYNQSWLLGLIVAIITYVTIIGGIKAIGKFTSKVTPLMCTLYVTSAFIICLVNIHHFPHAIHLILTEAFRPQAIGGGMFACMLWGFRRAMFANEAGLGTAPIAFSAVPKSFFFLPTQIFGYEGIELTGNGYVPASHHHLLPTLPANKPDGFVFSTLYYAITGGQSVPVRKNNTNITTISTGANLAYHVKLDYTAGESCTFYVGGIPVAKTESSCNSPYYLVWIQNDGALNCQPFTNTSKFSISYTNKI